MCDGDNVDKLCLAYAGNIPAEEVADKHQNIYNVGHENKQSFACEDDVDIPKFNSPIMPNYDENIAGGPEVHVEKQIDNIFSENCRNNKSVLQNLHHSIENDTILNIANKEHSDNINDSCSKMDNIEYSNITILENRDSNKDNSNLSQEISQHFNSETLPDVNENSNVSVEMYKLQIKSLEQLLDEQREEVANLTERLHQQSERLSEGDRRSREMETRMDMMRKQVEQAIREKDAMVMRYAVSEKTVIEAKSARDAAVKNEKQAKAEADLLNAKLKSAHAEKSRICQMLDGKVHELTQSQKESSQLKKDVQSFEIKLKWTQNKLHNEMDAYRDAMNQVEKLQQQLMNLQAEKEQFQNNLQDSNRAKDLEVQLKETQAMLILERHDRENAESRCKQTTVACETAKVEITTAKEEIERLKMQMEQLALENGELETRATEVTALASRAAQCDTLAVQLQRERDRATSLEEEASGLRMSSLRIKEKADEACKRETEALEHLQRLTSDNVAARTKCVALESKLSELSPKYTAMASELQTTKSQLATANSRLDEEAVKRRRDSELLARHAAELTKECDEVRKQLDWQTSENTLLKKKNANSVRELTKELQRALKRCEAFDPTSQMQSNSSVGDSVSKRKGSMSSLSSYESVAGNTLAAEPHSTARSEANGKLSEDGLTAQETNYMREPTNQQLIERIVSLQRSLARRSERLEFLEEHSKQLTDELRAKSRIVRSLALKCPAGAIADTLSDQNKAECARRGGGVMAAVYGAEPDGDSGITLPLSLEMNRKLQAVLEDALLKNITLEENIETLGSEIARLLSSKK